MTININLKELWKNQPVEIPEMKEVFKKADSYRKKSLKKLILTNLVLIVTSIFIGFIWYYYQPELLSTKIGIVLTILAMIIYLIFYNLMIPILKKADNTLSSSEYLEQLLKIKEKQRFLQTTMMNIYFLMLTAGIGLYMFEYAFRMKFEWALISYGITLLWIGFNWFYFRPRSIKKQENAINGLIDKFENISCQLKNNNK